jgi:choline monooxygenase
VDSPKLYEREGRPEPPWAPRRAAFRFEKPHRFQNMVIDKMVGVGRVPTGDADTMTRMFPRS